MKMANSAKTYNTLPANCDDDEKYQSYLAYFPAVRTEQTADVKAFYQLDDLHRALDFYKKIVEFVEVCTRLEEMDQALKFSKIGMELFEHPTYSKMHFARAEVLIKTKQFKEAEAILTKLVDFYWSEGRSTSDWSNICRRGVLLLQQCRK